MVESYEDVTRHQEIRDRMNICGIGDPESPALYSMIEGNRSMEEKLRHMTRESYLIGTEECEFSRRVRLLLFYVRVVNSIVESRNNILLNHMALSRGDLTSLFDMMGIKTHTDADNIICNSNSIKKPLTDIILVFAYTVVAMMKAEGILISHEKVVEIMVEYGGMVYVRYGRNSIFDIPSDTIKHPNDCFMIGLRRGIILCNGKCTIYD